MATEIWKMLAIWKQSAAVSAVTTGTWSMRCEPFGCPIQCWPFRVPKLEVPNTYHMWSMWSRATPSSPCQGRSSEDRSWTAASSYAKTTKNCYWLLPSHNQGRFSWENHLDIRVNGYKRTVTNINTFPISIFGLPRAHAACGWSHFHVLLCTPKQPIEAPMIDKSANQAIHCWRNSCVQHINHGQNNHTTQARSELLVSFQAIQEKLIVNWDCSSMQAGNQTTSCESTI